MSSVGVFDWGRGKRASATTTWGPRLLRLLHITSLGGPARIPSGFGPSTSLFSRTRTRPPTENADHAGPSAFFNYHRSIPLPPLARRRDPGLPRRATPPPAASLPAPRRPVPHPPRVPVRQVHAKRIRRGGEFRASPRTARPRKFNGVPAPAHVMRAPGA
ncbi:hypothetical protein PVAP13_9NG283173 [Panicum virgatum]|uniref:Uncharacterized protein n=1 Tax=Panicum virgatum TaxID=38727 RepID=A0A8T0ME26_PANVG|nr:hypothetical protein PVAP13_9NG283173 [Panicum virgatum]